MSHPLLRELPSVGVLLDDPAVSRHAHGRRRVWVTRIVQRVIDGLDMLGLGPGKLRRTHNLLVANFSGGGEDCGEFGVVQAGDHRRGPPRSRRARSGWIILVIWIPGSDLEPNGSLQDALPE